MDKNISNIWLKCVSHSKNLILDRIKIKNASVMIKSVGGKRRRHTKRRRPKKRRRPTKKRRPTKRRWVNSLILFRLLHK